MINRRSFLKLGSYSAALITLPHFSFAKSNAVMLGTAIGSGKYKNKKGETKFILSLFDMDNLKKPSRFIPVDFFVHGITPNPVDPYKFVLFEKKGPGACEVDLRSGRVTRTIKTISERFFYGHGVYSKDAKILYATEANLKSKSGVVSMRDAQTMKLIGNFPTYGHNPHDCMLINDGNTLAITNGGGSKASKQKPCVSYVDINSKKLIEKVEVQKNDINAGHLSISQTNDLVLVSAPREGLDTNLPGAISFRPNGKELTTATEPQKIIKGMKSETLSLALINAKNLVAATSPKGNMISFWNYKKASFISSINIDNPRSIGTTLDEKYFVVGHSKNASLSLIKTETLKLEEGFTFPNAGFSGSHLFIWKRPV